MLLNFFLISWLAADLADYPFELWKGPTSHRGTLTVEKIYRAIDIPGMIEPKEQTLLEQLAREIQFDENESVVEFGTFFGRSTASISAGLKSNETFARNSGFYAYDSFECDLEGGFYRHVRDNAVRANVTDLLLKRGNRVDFFPIFEKYLDHYIKKGILRPQKCELKNSFPKGEAIRLMHIDSPKFYDEFRLILFRFSPI